MFKEGKHDLQKGMCSKKRFELVAKGLAQRKFAEGVDLNPQRPEDKIISPQRHRGHRV